MQGESGNHARFAIAHRFHTDEGAGFGYENSNFEDNGDHAKMKELETQFKEPQFCKCHRSYIVNLKYAGKISREGVEMDDKGILPISKSCWDALNHCYMEYYMG